MPNRPEIAIRSVRVMGTFARRRTDKWHLIGQDGGQSVPTKNGTLFLFSDTLLAALSHEHPFRPVPKPFSQAGVADGIFLANSAGFSNEKDLRRACAQIEYFEDEDGFMREILSPLDRERAQRIRFWPEHGICLDDKVYFYYLGIQTTDPTTIWGFQSMGTGLALLDPRSGDCERVWWEGHWRLWKTTLKHDFRFGVKVLEEDGWVYVFGSFRVHPYHRASLARVRADEISSPESYQYLLSSRPRWGSQFTEAVDLGPCGADYSVSFNTYLGRYLMLYLDEYEKILTMRTADRIWGPYSAPIRIARVPYDPSSELVYLGFEHAQFSEDQGKSVFISYCQPRFSKISLVTVKFH